MAKYADAYNIQMSFEISGEAQLAKDSSDGGWDFPSIGGVYHFKVMDQPKVSMEKEGTYIDTVGANSGKLAYKVTVNVDHGKLYNAKITDTITPPTGVNYKVEWANDATVTLTRDGVSHVLAKIITCTVEVSSGVISK